MFLTNRSNLFSSNQAPDRMSPNFFFVTHPTTINRAETKYNYDIFSTSLLFYNISSNTTMLYLAWYTYMFYQFTFFLVYLYTFHQFVQKKNTTLRMCAVHLYNVINNELDFGSWVLFLIWVVIFAVRMLIDWITERLVDRVDVTEKKIDWTGRMKLNNIFLMNFGLFLSC